MPLYEYQCQECGETTEVIQRFDDEPFTICSSCGGTLKKLVSAPAIKFKGSGFYLTDYGKSGSSATKLPAESTSNEKTTSDSKDSTKTSSDSSSTAGSSSGASKSSSD